MKGTTNSRMPDKESYICLVSIFYRRTEALDVIEMLKPELAQIIRDGDENEEDIKDIILVENSKKVTKKEIDKEMKEFEKELNGDEKNK